ncbi:M81 family metallopeptidase [Paenibacillus sp. J2TS4]|uniref:M81 family metallopeptidase n=1 Tax=Paenibacillus sp. J2TS4 TaxID=2807194 RepID=UPI001B266D8F|nr:M81 family metallopeptidase [Paenibacillus sp. J2TS4]GIP31231.1 microcystinase C [Paenibacillus sp. J2TS4]
MNRIGVVGMFHETNCFAPGMTEIADFQRLDWTESSQAFHERYENTRTSMGGIIDGARSNRLELVAGLYTAAVPGGIVSAAAEKMMDLIVASIEPELDGLIVILHGAMVSETYEDMEGELLSRIRKKVGSALPIAITVDLHANMSLQMVQLSDFIVGFDTYPHVDMYERAVEAVELLSRNIRGEIIPAKALSHTRLLVAPQAMLTSEGMMKDMMDRAFAMELLPGVLNVTVCGGFPYSDVPDAGMSFLVTTDRDERLAQELANELGELARKSMGNMLVTGVSAEQAVMEAAACESGPVVLIEGSDNVGGGAPGDATHILIHLLPLSVKSLIVIHDEQAAREASQLAEGALYCGEIGGRSGALSGQPVWIEGTIRGISQGKFQNVGPFATGRWSNMGRTVVVEAGSLTVMITENRVPPYDIGHVLSVGIDPERYKIIVVKSAVAWKTSFGSIAKKEIQVDTPGCCSFNLEQFTYKKALCE